MTTHRTAVITATVLAFILVAASILYLTQQTFIPRQDIRYSFNTPVGQTSTIRFDTTTLTLSVGGEYREFSGCSQSFTYDYACGGDYNCATDANGCQICAIQLANICTFTCNQYRCDNPFIGRTGSLPRGYSDTGRSCSVCGSYEYVHGGSNYATRQGCTYTWTLIKDGQQLGTGTNDRSTHYYDLAPYALSFGSTETNSNGCVAVSGTLTLTPLEDWFTITTTKPSQTVIEDTDSTFVVTVENTYRDVSANLIVDYEAPTTLGTARNQTITPVIIKTGTNTYTITIPTTDVANLVRITPHLDILQDTSNFAGLRHWNGATYDGVPALTSLGTLDGPTEEFQIVPRPLYLKKSLAGCQAGYAPATGLTDWCVRTDIADFTCYQLGCPVLDDPTIRYSCTSAGICAQTVYQQASCKTNTDCGAGMQCDAGSGHCFDEKIINTIFQCTTASDCAKPCDGIDIACTDNKCSYGGECTVREVPVIVQELADQQSVFTPGPASTITPPTTASTTRGLLIALAIFAVILTGSYMIATKKKKRGTR